LKSLVRQGLVEHDSHRPRRPEARRSGNRPRSWPSTHADDTLTPARGRSAGADCCRPTPTSGSPIDWRFTEGDSQGTRPGNIPVEAGRRRSNPRRNQRLEARHHRIVTADIFQFGEALNHAKSKRKSPGPEFPTVGCCAHSFSSSDPAWSAPRRPLRRRVTEKLAGRVLDAFGAPIANANRDRYERRHQACVRRGVADGAGEYFPEGSVVRKRITWPQMRRVFTPGVAPPVVIGVDGRNRADVRLDVSLPFTETVRRDRYTPRSRGRIQARCELSRLPTADHDRIRDVAPLKHGPTSSRSLLVLWVEFVWRRKWGQRHGPRVSDGRAMRRS